MRYIYQYIFLITIVFIGVPRFLGNFTTSGLYLNLIVVHVLFILFIRHKEKERTERIRQKRLKELTHGVW